MLLCAHVLRPGGSFSGSTVRLFVHVAVFSVSRKLKSLRCFSFCFISFMSFLGALAKQLRQASIRVVTSVRPSSWKRAAPTGRVFMFSALTKTCPSISILFNFGNMCTCIYCVLCCLYCVFCVVSFMCILICFVCTGVRTTATE